VNRVARALFLLASLLVALPALAGEVLVDFLDVGQGDSILIRGGGKAVLIDAGIKGARVAEQLRALGVARLDLVVTTHPHADHMGGMEDVVRAFDVGLYLDNGLPHTTETYAALMTAIEERQIPYRKGEFGMTLNLGSEAVFHVLFPEGVPLTDTRSDLNSNSVVMLLTHGDVDFLFTGDSEEPTEHIIARRDLPSIEVLKVAHHGSAHSSTSGFLGRVRPTYAVISCGVGNRYGHPDPEALDRLRAVGAQIYRTDESGHLRAVSNGRVVEILEGAVPEVARFRPPTTTVTRRPTDAAPGAGLTPPTPGAHPTPGHPIPAHGPGVRPGAPTPPPAAPTPTPDPAGSAVAPAIEDAAGEGGRPRREPRGARAPAPATTAAPDPVPPAPVPAQPAATPPSTAPANTTLNLSGVRPSAVPAPAEEPEKRKKKKRDRGSGT
jgi:beta-lactamase superfamily II metal-dependent hydrolase